MLIKICGITRLDDAQEAVALGAGALGFVFWPKSPRFVEPEQARAIIAAMPPFVAMVGVFVNQTARLVNGVAARVGLSAVQLHGDESVEYIDGIDRPVVKSFAVREDVPDVAVDVWPARVRMLLDVHDPEARGGTGRTVNWTRAAALAGRRPVILAGGLTPENVAEAVRSVRPFGIDVSSGVESAPGVKDHARLRALFDAVRNVNRTECRSESSPRANERPFDGAQARPGSPEGRAAAGGDGQRPHDPPEAEKLSQSSPRANERAAVGGGGGAPPQGKKR